MKNNVLAVFAVSCLVAALSTPVFAQSLRIEANIPFEFVAGGKTLTAGEYSVANSTTPGTLTIRNESNQEGAMVISHAVQASPTSSSFQAKLVFHRYGNQYFLAQVWGGYDSFGRQLPTTRNERAASESAALRQPEEVVILARR